MGNKNYVDRGTAEIVQTLEDLVSGEVSRSEYCAQRRLSLYLLNYWNRRIWQKTADFGFKQVKSPVASSYANTTKSIQSNGSIICTKQDCFYKNLVTGKTPAAIRATRGIKWVMQCNSYRCRLDILGLEGGQLSNKRSTLRKRCELLSNCTFALVFNSRPSHNKLNLNYLDAVEDKKKMPLWSTPGGIFFCFSNPVMLLK